MRRVKKRKWSRTKGRTTITRETEDEQIDRLLRTKTFLKRHPEPHNKRDSGRMRRQERKFTAAQRAAWLDANNHGARSYDQ